MITLGVTMFKFSVGETGGWFARYGGWLWLVPCESLKGGGWFARFEDSRPVSKSED